MTTNTLPPRTRHTPTTILAYGTQVFWTVVVATVEMIVIACCAFGAFLAYSAVVYGVIFFRSDYVLASIAVGALYVALCIADNQYDLLGPEWNEHSRSRGGAALALSFITLLTAGYLTNSLGGYSRGTFLAQLLATLLGQIAVRAALRQVVDRVREHGHWRRESMAVLVMPGARGVGHVRARLAARHEHILRWYDFPSVPDGTRGDASLEVQLCEIRRECRALPIDAVLILFGSDNMEVVSHTVAELSELPVRIQLLPIELAELMRRSRIGSYGHLRVLELFCGPCSLRDRFLKRAFDIVGSAALLTILWPLLVAVAALIKLDSRGPVLFKQMRLGFNNEPIQVLKFRSMSCMEDARDGFRQAVRDDPRVTRVGRVLRRTNIDELPQLLNVLRGEMSLVGPRPHAVAHNHMFADQIHRMFRRHNVKPGITGWAQVNGLRGETDTFEKMQKRIEHDLYYVDNWSFFFDLKILVRTVISKQAYSNAY
ncbi:exopolysaccharide biosynthesis polyprenyl glycosylphosphotransferase [uncultured Bosea sp.]|uniref:exopolysaccharide biosynthesis polyprenyl glycosylphosphotransferase n=1 Tax=uncultured Bosea sp. TaxID=211457 RepID=UPI0025FBBB3B|nr:exopolysaccharide biosynthesis polyprenyl glycosylphosphotransferase [uncultured Bosea sp.]